MSLAATFQFILFRKILADYFGRNVKHVNSSEQKRSLISCMVASGHQKENIRSTLLQAWRNSPGGGVQ